MLTEQDVRDAVRESDAKTQSAYQIMEWAMDELALQMRELGDRVGEDKGGWYRAAKRAELIKRQCWSTLDRMTQE